MKYLGIYYKKQYYRDTSVEHYVSKAFGYKPFDTEVLMKEAIRKHVLPTYQPTKTLEWLEEQTGVKFMFEYQYQTLFVLNGGKWEEVYDFKDNTAYTLISDIGITFSDEFNEKWVEMTPREFIEKIAKGEWV